MIRHAITRVSIFGAMIGSLLFAGVASAIDWNITGFVRQEIAYGIYAAYGALVYLTPLIGGYLADKYGGKKVLGYGLLLWSFFTYELYFLKGTSNQGSISPTILTIISFLLVFNFVYNKL